MNMSTKGNYEMTPLLAILFALVCIAVQTVLSGSEKTAKAKLRIKNHAPKA
jgi:uncharacterized membrane protein YciS (DUF1049 family)